MGFRRANFPFSLPMFFGLSINSPSLSKLLACWLAEFVERPPRIGVDSGFDPSTGTNCLTTLKLVLHTGRCHFSVSRCCLENLAVLESCFPFLMDIALPLLVYFAALKPNGPHLLACMLFLLRCSQETAAVRILTVCISSCHEHCIVEMSICHTQRTTTKCLYVVMIKKLEDFIYTPMKT